MCDIQAAKLKQFQKTISELEKTISHMKKTGVNNEQKFNYEITSIKKDS
jgi:hypothetical protein